MARTKTPAGGWHGKPVCGCPDAMLANATAEARWPTKDITYYIAAPDRWPGLTADQVREAFRLAWSWWAAVCGINPREVATPAEALVRVECKRIDGVAGVLAWSELANGSLQPKQQRYDSTESWVVSENPGNTVIDLARVACHEIGHVLGIPHIEGGNLLAPTYSVTVRRPQVGDIREAQARYGPPLSPPAPPPVPTPTPGPQPLPPMVMIPGSLLLGPMRDAGYVIEVP